MSLRRVWPVCGSILLLVAAAAVRLPAQQAPRIDPSLFGEMRWRNIGPFRAGRTKAAAGHPSQPYTFYIGVCNGGVWKTTDAGRTWKSIFDDQPTGSIGWVAVAPSDPNVVYVASGEGLPRPDLSVGDGIYKSTDAGATWTHLGLRDAQQIPKLAIDPKNPNRVFVAALGHPYGPSEERGIFRSTDGGRTFDRVLFKNVNTGGKDVDIDPANPDVVYATLWEQRQGPWENGAWSGTNGGIFKSTDGGATWKQLKQGLPDGLVDAELDIAPSNPRRLYATVDAGAATGVYRSDDAGETWTRSTSDARPTSRVNESTPHVNPKDPDSLIVTDVVSYKSSDGGRTFAPFKGAPGGDDNQNLWWNPNDPNIMLMVIDQGAVVTLNGGETWSSWFTQPTAALYHVMADNAFPYRVCGGQQDSGSVCVASRGNDGQITFREWHPVGVEEYGYAAPDPLNPDLVYGGKVTRYDRRTGQVSDVGPTGGRGRGGPTAARPAYRTVRTQPVVFSTVDPHAMFYGNNVLWKTLDGGLHWKQISPDVTREKWDVPKSVGTYAPRVTARERGAIGAQVIYTIGPSYKDINRIWIGTDDGLIYTTADGGANWTNVTPPQMTDFMKVFTIDPGRFDALTAYAAVNTLRLDDMSPHIFRTHDGGRTWTEIVNGIPGGAPVSVVREDPKRKGLLFAGSETQVYVSFDDGDHWQSLRLNMAASSVRDLIVKDDDLVVGTHGRGIWILDDITPLRQIADMTGTAAPSSDRDAILFKPQTALRVRWNTNTDTPLPPDEPTAPNPPEGAIVDYYLKSAASGLVVLEIAGADGKLVRRYSSGDDVFRPDPATINLPLYWFRPLRALPTAVGMHRYTWDLHYQPLDQLEGPGRLGGPNLPIAAVGHNTVPAPTTPWVSPGPYTVKLTVNGKTYSQPIVVKQDPRVKTPALAMQQIYTLSKTAYYGAVDARMAASRARALHDRIAGLQPQATGDAAAALAALDKKIEALEPAPAEPAGRGRGGRGGGGGGGGRGRGAGTTTAPDSLSAGSAALSGVMNLLQAADVPPTAVQLAAIADARATAAKAMARWTAIKTVDVPAVNAKLKAARLPLIEP